MRLCSRLFIFAAAMFAVLPLACLLTRRAGLPEGWAEYYHGGLAMVACLWIAGALARDSGSDRNGEDPRSGAEGEASQSGPEGASPKSEGHHA